MLSTLRFVRRTPGQVLFRSFSAAGDTSPSWLSSPGNPLMRWPPFPTPQPQTYSPHQVSADPQDVPSFSNEEGETLPDVDDEAVASISSLIRSTPISDLNSALRRTGFLHSSNLSSVLHHLIRAHSFDLAWSLLLSQTSSPLSVYASLFRRYSRSQMPSAAIRTFLFLRGHSHLLSPTSDDDPNPLELLLDALCKEGHPRSASDFLAQLKSEDPNWIPSVRCYNILLHGWFRLRKLKKVERLWSEMRRQRVPLTVVSYGTVIEGLCRMRRPDQAMVLLEEMRASGIDPNLLTCNPIVDSLSEAARFRESLSFVERFPVFGISPNISTFNSLIKGFCKNGDLPGASNVLKTMIGKGILPTSTTYNYFFRFFTKFGKVEESMNLYSKMIQSGYAPDRLSFQLIIKMLCDKERLDLAVQLIKEMNRSGLDLDLATGTMLVHLLCCLRRYDEAFNMFVEMFTKGILPQYITYQKLSNELKKLGLVEMEEKLSALMNSVPHSTKLPATYRDKGGGEEAERKSSILKKAQAMSEALKERKDMDQLTNLKTFEETVVGKADNLMKNIRRRVYALKS
ncbi:Pentatricopeptide repeat-containing protein [Platanthera zijinensis]|uniref:Pentatricopeptide repeat-containing protein n=1 Tax=Platanthera zijinensis TaxID=2320716 RepID=A0AAP0BTP2_9ASPA